MTYFPIPGEGAWVLLREFCQRKEAKTLSMQQDSGHTFTKMTTYMEFILRLLGLKAILISGPRKQGIPLSVR